MTKLIIPAAGQSTRYGLSRPKFLLQHPKGTTMVTAGLLGLRGLDVDEVIVVSLSEFFESISQESVKTELIEHFGCNVNLVLLDKSTPSMVDTIAAGIQTMQNDDAIIVKDTDNYIEVSDLRALQGDFLTFADLRSFPEVKAHNKSFIESDSQRFVSNIVEKKIISSEINTGLIGFSRASYFLRAMKALQGTGERYVSDVVRYLLSEGENFVAVPAKDYIDWGTLAEWRSYCSKFATVFVDIDGVIAVNENPHGTGTNNWSTFRSIDENIAPLVDGQNKGNLTIVFTTSRSEMYRDLLTSQIELAGFKGFTLVMGLPHAKRILINDFANTNPYPTALAINLERNARNLSSYLNPLFPQD